MSLNILAVDDSRTIRDVLKLALAQAGFEPQVAEDGLHGLEVLEDMVDDGTPPDAIITDINMPRMDGFGFIDAVRAKDEHRAVPILVLSTESADELKARARTSGASGWIVKPFDPVKLVRAINMVAGKGAA